MKISSKFYIIILLFCALVQLPACAEKENPVENQKPGTGGNTDKPKVRNLYISVNDGNDANNGLAAQFAVQSFNRILEILKPGDIVNIMPGTYESKGGKPVLELGPLNSGEEGKPITFKAYDPNNKPVFYGHGEGTWRTFRVNASYIIVDGIEVRGDARVYNVADSYAASEAYFNTVKNGGKADINALAKYNTNGISVDGDGGAGKFVPVHVTVRNCVVHDMPGGGMGASNCDYVTFENNISYNNCWHTMYACSGISVMHHVNTDSNYDEHKIIIRGNILFNNITYVPWYRPNSSDMSKSKFERSDGNGIILDINNKTDYAGGPYKSRTLVCNNLSVFNGGSGIHAYCADHVDIVNNTAFMNGRRYPNGEYADIYAHSCTDVSIANNIMYGRPDGDCNKKGKAANGADPGIIYENNVMYNGKNMYNDASYARNCKIADPRFKSIPTSISNTQDWTVSEFNQSLWESQGWDHADFSLQEGSPAIGAGTSKPFMPSVDILGNPRDRSRIDAGAYYFTGK